LFIQIVFAVIIAVVAAVVVAAVAVTVMGSYIPLRKSGINTLIFYF